MKNKITYTDEPMELEAVRDILPPPEELVRRESDGVKVTIVLGKETVDFFKRHADKAHAPYQRMIRRVLDIYAERFDTATPAAKKGGR